MFAERASADHLAFSAAMKAANSAGEFALAMAPSFVSRSWMSGACIPWLIAALSLATIAAGVPAGAAMPLKVAT